MGKQLELMAAVYKDEEGAKTVLDTLEMMHSASNITLADAAIVMKDDDGKLKIKETREVTAAKGAKRGAVVTGVLGLIFPPALIASVLAGGVIGGAWGRLRDTRHQDWTDEGPGQQPGARQRGRDRAGRAAVCEADYSGNGSLQGRVPSPRLQRGRGRPDRGRSQRRRLRPVSQRSAQSPHCVR